METDKPWERWQYFHRGTEEWKSLKKLNWNPNVMYRRKPKMISATLANGEVVSWPEPHRTELEHGDSYFCFIPTHGDIMLKRWDCAPWDRTTLFNGYIHLTKEAAEQHHYALFKINNQVMK